MASIYNPASNTTASQAATMGAAGAAHLTEPSTANPNHLLSNFPEMTNAKHASAIQQTIHALNSAQLQVTLSAFLGGRNKAKTMSKLRKQDTFDRKDCHAAIQWCYQMEQYVKKANLAMSFDQICLACSYLVGDFTPFIERIFNMVFDGQMKA